MTGAAGALRFLVMKPDRKTHFIDELRAHYSEIIAAAHQAETASAQGAHALQSQARTKEDGKSAASEARLAAAHRQRRQQAVEELGLADAAAAKMA